MGMPPSPWEKLSFASKGEVNYGTIMCANRLAASLHQIVTALHIPTMQAIHATLATSPNLGLLGMFVARDTAVEAICIHKTIYFPSPFMGNFLEHDIMPVEAWSCLCDAIFDARATFYFHPIIYWIWVTLTRKSGLDQPSPLAVSQPTTPLVDGKLMRHRHQVLTRHPPGLDSSLHNVQGSIIATHIGGVVVEMR